MLDSFPRNLVILGGGSAGWLAAAYLDRSFNLPGRHRLPITVVESPQIGRIGVGEATIPSIRDVMLFLGIDEPTFMKRTRATFKQGIRFVDWNGPGSDYFHAFEALEQKMGLNPGPSWLARNATGEAASFDHECGTQRSIALAGLAPKRMTDPDFIGPLPYAYHFDAESFGDLLGEVARDRGVTHVQGLMVGVEKTNGGEIAALLLDDGTRVEGDFFIDCSGFEGLLIGKALKAGFESFAADLLCDSAVTIQRPYVDDGLANCFTTATALSAGWSWRIGLQNREGLGYVYSSRFLDKDGAEAELRATEGLSADLPARHITMKVGMRPQPWSRNVVAMGLAGGFIEPLESTGIYLTEVALRLLVRYFPLSGINPAARDRFNLKMRNNFSELRDFVVAHYCLTKRDDSPFWKAVTKPEHIPASLASRLAIWADRHPSLEDNDEYTALFGPSNWQSILYGMQSVGPDAVANAARWCPQPGAHLSELQQAKNELMTSLPSHRIWLEGLQTYSERTDWGS